MKKQVILVGGGGHCRSVIEVIGSTNEFEILGIVDANLPVGSDVLGYEVLGNDDDIQELMATCSNFVITVGMVKSASVRKALFEKVKSLGGEFPVIKASTAYVSKHAKIGEGTVLMHQSFVNANAAVGSNCIVNTGAIIEHDTVVGNHAHISTKAVLNGGVTIGSEVMIGSNATILQEVKIGEKATVGAGTVVTKDVASNVVLISNVGNS